MKHTDYVSQQWNSIWSTYIFQQKLKLLVEFDDEIRSFLTNSYITHSCLDVLNNSKGVITMSNGKKKIHLVCSKKKFKVDEFSFPFHILDNEDNEILSFINQGINLVKVSNQYNFQDDIRFINFLRWKNCSLTDIKSIHDSGYLLIILENGKRYIIMDVLERQATVFHSMKSKYRQFSEDRQAHLPSNPNGECEISLVSELTGLSIQEISEDNSQFIHASEAIKLITQHCTESIYFEYLSKHESYNNLINESRYPEVNIDNEIYIYRTR